MANSAIANTHCHNTAIIHQQIPRQQPQQRNTVVSGNCVKPMATPNSYYYQRNPKLIEVEEEFEDVSMLYHVSESGGPKIQL